MKVKLVEVRWKDARAHAGWFEYDKNNPPPNHPVVTYGLLVDKRDDAVILASTIDPDTGEWADRNEIPAQMLVSVKTVKTVEV